MINPFNSNFGSATMDQPSFGQGAAMPAMPGSSRPSALT